MNRRQFLGCLAVAPLADYSGSFRFSVCNETFQGARFEEQCRMAREIGYGGIEIMPGTLSENPVTLTPERRAELRRVITNHGLHFVGLHNILTVPPGLHATAEDPLVRQRTWEFIRRLADLCADLGDSGLMVFGSGKQREIPPVASRADALARFKNDLASVATHADDRSVTILIEPLAPRLCNFINRLDEAAAVVREVGSPAVKTMFDVHNTAGETLPASDLIDKYVDIIRHVHLNEMDGRRPGTGSYDYAALFRALQRQQYEGWLSLEVFDFHPTGEAVAAESLRFVKSVKLTGGTPE